MTAPDDGPASHLQAAYDSVFAARRGDDLDAALRAMPELLRTLAVWVPTPPEAQDLIYEVTALLYGKGRKGEAAALAWTALALQPQHVSLHNVLGLIEGSGDESGPHSADGLVWFARGLTLEPRAEDARVNMGRVAIRVFAEAAENYRCGRLDLAEMLCRGLLRAWPGHAGARALARMIGRVRRGEAEIAGRRETLHPLAGGRPPPRTGGRPVWAAVIGAIRDPAEFLRIARLLATIRSFGLLDGIVVSTWKGHVSGKAELRDALAGLDIAWVENEEPRIVIKWNTVQQMMALNAALAACPPDADVLKCRTDKIYTRFYETFILDTLLHRERLEPDGAAGGLLEGRIVVPNAALLAPFHLNDMVFFGRSGDLKRLVNFDLRYLFSYRHMSTEQWLFSSPFVGRFSIFDAFFRVWPGHPSSHTGHRVFFEAFRDDPFFIDAFATHLHVLLSHFRIGGHAGHADLFAEAQAHLAHHTAAGVMDELGTTPIVFTAYYEYFLAPLAAGRLAPDGFGRRVRESLERVADPAFHAPYAAPGALERDEVRRFAALADRTVAAWSGRSDVWRTSGSVVAMPDFWQAV